MNLAAGPAVTSAARPLLCVVGARPNYMKMAPVIAAFQAICPHIPALLIHTGQHYDASMNAQFFAELGLPQPTVNLDVGSGTHAAQTAEIMKRFEAVVDAHRPIAVLVVGDVNSTLACALVAAKKEIAVIHIEAGLRSYDRSMPEEINRVLTDQIADVLYTTERTAHDNLKREGIAAEHMHFVGNVMIDSLRTHQAQATPAHQTLTKAEVSAAMLAHIQDEGYGLVTLHRPSNVDAPQMLQHLVEVLCAVSEKIPLVFALHPRTRAKLEAFGLATRLQSGRIVLLPPQAYFDMLGLMMEARVVLTDSGGVQDETTALGVPCLTLRDNTERPITITAGTNTLVGQDAQLIHQGIDAIVQQRGKSVPKPERMPELWDGKAAERIARHLSEWLNRRTLAQAA